MLHTLHHQDHANKLVSIAGTCTPPANPSGPCVDGTTIKLGGKCYSAQCAHSRDTPPQDVTLRVNSVDIYDCMTKCSAIESCLGIDYYTTTLSFDQNCVFFRDTIPSMVYENIHGWDTAVIVPC